MWINNFIGTKLYKGKYETLDWLNYIKWCNENNAHMEDKGEYYEIVENTPIELTTEEKIENIRREITSDLLASAILGDSNSINILQTKVAEINELKNNELEIIEEEIEIEEPVEIPFPGK